MANKRICIQIDFNGPNPIIQRSSFAVDKRLTLTNIAKLLRGLNHGALPSRLATTKVVVQDSLVQATGTCTPAAAQVNDTVTPNGQALTAKQLRASGTVTAATAIAGNTATINGQVFTGVAGAAVPGEATFSIDTGDTETAASLAAQINAYQGSLIKGIVKAKSAAAVCTVYAVALGTVGNAIPLASSGATLAVSGATLANGAAVANNQFDCTGSNAETADDIARCVGASTTAAIKNITASSNGAGVCTFTALAPGAAGNAVTLVSSGARLAVSGAGTFTGGSAGNATNINL